MGKDWIEYIVKEVIRNYNGRKIVLWGKYAVSDDISSRLKENYGIETAFYVDSDSIKVDGKQVLSPDCLCGNKGKFFGRAGLCSLWENVLLKIGKKSNIGGNYGGVLDANTSIHIGNDCMFSHDINIRSKDGHSIFDIETGKNINSSYGISRT